MPSLPEQRLIVADRLHSASIHLLRDVRREDEATGISAARLSALSVLVFAGPLSLGNLAESEQVTSPTMSRIVDGLESAGLARREHDADDRRVVSVRATPRGVRVLHQARRRRVRRLTERFAHFSRRELNVLEEASGLLERSFGSH
jgi:DNA-binding MarR family transcriptional regulator